MPSYPRPTNFLPTVSLPTRRLGLLPLERPPHEDIPLASLPPLPSSQRKSLLHPSWSMTTHLVPAAFPRTTPYFPPHKLPTFDGDENKAEYQKEVGRLAREVLDLKERDFYHAPTAERDTSVLWTCVNRYVNNPSPTSSTGLTLLFAHANGFPKEVSRRIYIIQLLMSS